MKERRNNGTSGMLPVIMLLMWICMAPAVSARQAEQLDRGVVASRAVSGNKALVSWRMFETDPSDIAFNVYRASGGGAPVKLNETPITTTTNFMDATLSFSVANTYTVKSVRNGVETDEPGRFVLPANPEKLFFRIPVDYIEAPGAGYTYSLSDCATGDLDGDGTYDIVVKWDPSNAQDNSNSGVTGNVYLDAYKLDGTKLWRVNLGPNIRAGAHYTQMVVYDLDGDGKAEVAVKTAELTVFGDGQQIGDTDGDGVTNYVNPSTGYILYGPEFLSIIDGPTGKELARTDYIPRGGAKPSDWKSEWGDDYGNRIDRYLAGMGYFDGERPSLLICRGYYSKTVLEAWDYRNGQLTRRWNFTADSEQNSSYRGQGNHSLIVGDVDGDGKDEIIYGACAIDDDGSPLYNTRMGHGDAMHMSDMDPRRPGLEVWRVHESKSAEYGSDLRDAATGELIFGIYAGDDVGRGMAADIDPNSFGYEMWSSRTGGVRSLTGQVLNSKTPSINFGIFWTGGLNRELLDGTEVVNYKKGTVLSAGSYGSSRACNGTKNTPNLSADILGDWREEIIYHSSDSRYLLVFVSADETQYRFHTLMHDPLYRSLIVTQNVAYNQPPHLSYYLGSDLGRMIQDRDVIVSEDFYMADAGYDYDSVVWSTGATGRVVRLEPEAYDVKTKYTADVYMRGQWFRDSLYVTFRSHMPLITRQPLPSDTVLCTGEEVTMQVVAEPGEGQPITGYQWYRDGEPLADGTGTVYVTAEPGAYHVVVASGPFEAVSREVRVSVQDTPVITMQPTGGNWCIGGAPLRLEVQASPVETYVWSRNGQVLADSGTPVLMASEGGIYQVELGNGRCKVVSESATVYRRNPPVVSISVPENSNLLTAESSSVLTAYAWSDARGAIAGATEKTYRAMTSGTYTVQVTDQNGCSASVSRTVTGITAAEADLKLQGLNIFPNPADEALTVQLPSLSGHAEIRVTGASGAQLYSTTARGGETVVIPLENWPAGLYLLDVRADGVSGSYKFMKR